MKKILFYTLLIAIIALILGACNHEHKESNEHKHEKINELTLNKNKRWGANKETTEGISNMKKIVANYQKPINSDLRVLGDELQEELDLLIEECTMEGEAHNQLHYYLTPLIKLIGELKSGNKVSENQIIDINNYLDQYSEYFR